MFTFLKRVAEFTLVAPPIGNLFISLPYSVVFTIRRASDYKLYCNRPCKIAGLERCCVMLTRSFSFIPEMLFIDSSTNVSLLKLEIHVFLRLRVTYLFLFNTRASCLELVLTD